MVMNHVIVEIIPAGDTGMSQTGTEESESVNWDALPAFLPQAVGMGGGGGGVEGGEGVD